MNDYIFTMVLGYHFSIILNFIGIVNGQEGVDYYGEAHLSQWNSLIHTLFMPFTIYGFLLAIPALLNLNNEYTNQLQNHIYIFYISHYISINLFYGLAFALIYDLPLTFAQYEYKNNRYTLIKGLIISSSCLIIQEYVGHYLGNDMNSRWEGVLNAILYANYYSISSIFIQLK